MERIVELLIALVSAFLAIAAPFAFLKNERR
jgi:hypothetical protein